MKLAQLRTHAVHYSPVMIAPLSINSSQRRLQAYRARLPTGPHVPWLKTRESVHGRNQRRATARGFRTVFANCCFLETAWNAHKE
jgi:hypothetical protein